MLNVIHITMTETEVVCKKCSPIKYMVGFDIGVYAYIVPSFMNGLVPP